MCRSIKCFTVGLARGLSWFEGKQDGDIMGHTLSVVKTKIQADQARKWSRNLIQRGSVEIVSEPLAFVPNFMVTNCQQSDIGLHGQLPEKRHCSNDGAFIWRNFASSVLVDSESVAKHLLSLSRRHSRL